LTAIRDVSERARLEAQLRQRERLAAMGSLVAGVAHEVRTPLFSISATLDASAELFDSSEEGREVATLLRSQVDRLKNLMTDLLDYGRPPTLHLVAGGISDIILRASRACAAAAWAKGVTIDVQAPDVLTRVARDPGCLEQVFQNLLANAVYFTPDNGRVWVAVRNVPGGIEADVCDEGPGLLPEDIPRLFEPFFTRRRGGTGLGLPIVLRLVEAHGGTIDPGNCPGAGARIRVFLPAAPEVPA
jgi:signal transduction histidine kinase